MARSAAFQAVRGNGARVVAAPRWSEPPASPQAGRARPAGQGLRPSQVPARSAAWSARDRYEQEADRVADDVVRRLERRESGQPSAERAAAEVVTTGTGHMTGEGGPGRIQAKPLVRPARGGAGDGTEAAGQRARGGGRALTGTVRGVMEEVFSADFSGVRVHDDMTAHDLSEQLDAAAFTSGSDIFLRAGAPGLATADGRRLLAHELTHVLQQGAADGVTHAGRGGSRPAGVPPVQRMPHHAKTDKSGNWYADDRSNGALLLEVKNNNNPDDRTQYFCDRRGLVYRHDRSNDQYVNVHDSDKFWDPERDITLTRTGRAGWYYRHGKYVYRYDQGRYEEMRNLTDFQSGDLLYGTEKGNREHTRPIAEEKARGARVTADQYNKTVLAGKNIADPNRMDDEAYGYFSYLAKQGPGTAALVDADSSKRPGEDPSGVNLRLLRSCAAMIDYKTRRGYTIHFELTDTDLAERQYYTETELRFIIENRRFLNLEKIKFYRDGELLETTDVINEYKWLVDEVLDKGRVEKGDYAPQVAYRAPRNDPMVEFYDSPLNPDEPLKGSLDPNDPPKSPVYGKGPRDVQLRSKLSAEETRKAYEKLRDTWIRIRKECLQRGDQKGTQEAHQRILEYGELLSEQ
jgi:hypothetical protein